MVEPSRLGKVAPYLAGTLVVTSALGFSLAELSVGQFEELDALEASLGGVGICRGSSPGPEGCDNWRDKRETALLIWEGAAYSFGLAGVSLLGLAAIAGVVLPESRPMFRPQKGGLAVVW
jgi:hypothetical protein